MRDCSSLVAAALLSLLWAKEDRDYLDVLSQFVLRCIPQEIGVQVDVDSITSELRDKYGLVDMPRKVVEKIIIRLSKNKIKGKKYLRKQNHQFNVASVYESKEFDTAFSTTSSKILEVLTALSLYLEKNYLHKKIDDTESAEILFCFFDSYGLTVIRDGTSLRGITKANGCYDFYVSRFILEQLENNTIILNRLIEITEGFLIYKAVYLYSSDKKVSVESKLRDTMFFIDCSIIIDALGFDSRSDEVAFDEMCKLISDSGGQISVFEHTIEEAGNLILAYASNPDRRNTFNLHGLEMQDYTTDIIMLMARPQSLIEVLAKKGIKTCEVPSYKPTRKINGQEYYDGFEDEKKIENYLKTNNKKNSHNTNTSRYQYDAKSLSAIGRLREGHHPAHIEKCRALLVTQDRALCMCMHDLYPQNFPPEFDYAIKDIDLVSLLWLSKYNKKSQLPKHLLISYAVAAGNISQNIMENAIAMADKMAKDDAIPKDAALIIRSDPAIRKYLLEKTHNNPENLKEATIKDSIKEYIENKTKTDISIAIKPVEERAQKFEGMYKKAIDIMYREAENKAQKRGRFFEKAFLGLWIIIFIIITGLAVYLWIKEGFSIVNLGAIFLSLLSLLQLADFLVKYLNIARRLCKKAYEIVHSYFYEKEIRKIEKKLSESIPD